MTRKRGLMIPFKTHKGELVEKLILTKPDYIWWALQNKLSNFGYLYDHIKWCLEQFNRKEIIVPCEGCKGTATRFSAYVGYWEPWPFCDDCDPHSTGATQGKLVFAKTFQQAMEAIDWRSERNRGDSRALIADMATAKGLPKRKSKKAVLNFFHGEE